MKVIRSAVHPITRTCLVICAAAPMLAPGDDCARSGGTAPGGAERLAALACYLPATAAEWEKIVGQTGGLPPTQVAGANTRFESDTIVWTGNRSQGPSGQAKSATLTYSFPPDGATWGLAILSPTGPNVLNAELTSVFGPGALDLGREHFRQALAAWERRAGVRYSELADDGAAMDEVVAPSNARGDIRFGSVDLPGSLFAAYNAAPSASGSVGVGGGDMLINATQFTPEMLGHPTQSYLLLRNLVAHEHAHGLGLLHVVPCTNEKLMEPAVSGLFDGPQTDDARGMMHHYGDRFAGNQTATNARMLGELSTPEPRSVAERNLSTNGGAGPNGTGGDWFRFTLSAPQDVAITVTPTGGVYDAEAQLFGCFGAGFDPVREAQIAGDLRVELLDGLGTFIMEIGDENGPGIAESIVAPMLPVGEYTIRVVDEGPNDAQDQFVQMYDLEVRVADQPYAPVAVAGVDKRIAAGVTCYFIGDLNSSANEPGAIVAQYDWDLDGDGVFETLDNPRPTFAYLSNGAYSVSLRVTDSNLKMATDTIRVTVFGAATTITAATPDEAEQLTIVPVTLTGTNFKTVMSANEVSVLGGGVQVQGSPVSNSLGTSLSGLSFAVAADATPGPRDVRIQNQNGVGMGVGVFTVLLAQNNPADLTGDEMVDGADLAVLLASWGACPSPPASCAADFDQNGIVDGIDLSFILANWG